MTTAQLDPRHWFCEKHDIPDDQYLIRLFYSFRTGQYAEWKVPYYFAQDRREARFIMPGFKHPRCEGGINHFNLKGHTLAPEFAEMYVIQDDDFDTHRLFFLRQVARRHHRLYIRFRRQALVASAQQRVVQWSANRAAAGVNRTPAERVTR